MVSQLLLPMADHDQAYLMGAKVRAACRVVASDLGHKVVAGLWRLYLKDGVTPDERRVGLKLDETDRHYIKPSEMAALKKADPRGIIIAAEMDALGYEMPERKQQATDAEIVRRVPGVLRKYLADELAELIEKEIGAR